MKYLSDLGISDDIIEVLGRNLPEQAITALIDNQDNVTTNINYLKDLGIDNYEDAFTKFYNMFLLTPQEFDDIFSKYDKDDLIVKFEKNVAIMEYL